MKVTVTILDQDLRADAVRVAALRQVNSKVASGSRHPVQAATVQKLEDIILTRARDLRRAAVTPQVTRQNRWAGNARPTGSPIMSRFNPLKADARWQKVWDERRTFAAQDDSPKPKSYVLEMFPYPSGRIHMGHVRNYTMGDVLARYRRMNGGWKCSIRWGGTRSACRPRTPRWKRACASRGLDPPKHRDDEGAAQAAGLRARLEPRAGDVRARLLRARTGAVPRHARAAGLVYRKESSVNWDPVDRTVLANEQVIDGRGWRSGALVEKRKLSPVVPQDHAVRRRIAGRAWASSKDWPDKVQADAGKLDRQEPGAAVPLGALFSPPS